MSYRIERDSMGEVKVPASALYGAQTQRAMDNFGLHRRVLPPAFVHNLAMIKSAAARANAECGVLAVAVASAIEGAAARVTAGEFDGQFPVSLFQTGSGTSTNMNVNEVLARLASDASGEPVHPNDHVNCSQSSNDVIPSCILVSSARQLQETLLPALQALKVATTRRGEELSAVTKTGRTHLMDAMPLTFGQEMSAWVSQLEECQQRLLAVQPRLHQLPVGGSAVGTGVNVPAGFAGRLVQRLNQLSSLEFAVAPNAYARMAGQDVPLEYSAALRSLAVTLTKINNDLRWMASGPLAGLAEIELQPLQPGSSIMPGKVNPVLPEAVLMVAAEVLGNDSSVALAAQSGSFQLNVMLPLIAEKLSSSGESLSWACQATAATIAGLKVNTDRLGATLAINPILVTALNTMIGYEAAARIAKRSYVEQRPVIDVAAEETGMKREELETLLDPYRLTRGGSG